MNREVPGCVYAALLALAIGVIALGVGWFLWALRISDPVTATHLLLLVL